MPAFTTTKPLFKKTGILKLNDVYKLQICKLMRNTITGFDVNHNRFSLLALLTHITQDFQKKEFFF